MGRTHPQLPRSSDSHRILEGKLRQRWLVLMDPMLPAPLSREPGQSCGDPIFHHKPLLPGLSGLTETQEAEECGPHGSASVRQEAGQSKADRVTECGRRAIVLVQSAWCRSQGKMDSLFSRQGWKSVWASSLSRPHDPEHQLLFPKHCKRRRIWTDLAASWSSNSDSVYTMQYAFPKLMINLINLKSLQKRNPMYSPRISGSVEVPN